LHAAGAEQRQVVEELKVAHRILGEPVGGELLRGHLGRDLSHHRRRPLVQARAAQDHVVPVDGEEPLGERVLGDPQVRFQVGRPAAEPRGDHHPVDVDHQRLEGHQLSSSPFRR